MLLLFSPHRVELASFARCTTTATACERFRVESVGSKNRPVRTASVNSLTRTHAQLSNATVIPGTRAGLEIISCCTWDVRGTQRRFALCDQPFPVRARGGGGSSRRPRTTCVAEFESTAPKATACPQTAAESRHSAAAPIFRPGLGQRAQSAATRRAVAPGPATETSLGQ